jgi:protein involved in polysaccharide export with SLBB domain
MRRLLKETFSLYSAWAFVAVIVVAAGCSTTNSAAPSQGADSSRSSAPSDQSSPVIPANDPLRISDHVKIEFKGTAETIEPSEQEIGEDGMINVQFIGRVPAAGKTPAQLATDIENALKPKYYANLSVTVGAVGRFFYVGGEVVASGSGGRIIYSGPITVTRAIDAAGGFSPFASRRRVRLTRADGKTILVVNCIKALDHPDKDPPVYPGDRIYVPRRF